MGVRRAQQEQELKQNTREANVMANQKRGRGLKRKAESQCERMTQVKNTETRELRPK